MFYLETKDGDRFFTPTNSNDRAEFEKILEQKLGEQAVQLFNDIISEAEDTIEDSTRDECDNSRAIFDLVCDLRNTISSLQLMTNDDKVDKSDLETIITELNRIKDELDYLS